MKNILTLLLASASLSYGAANDLLIAQRNSTDTGQLTRLVAHPGGSNNGLVAFNGATLLPVCIQIGDGLVWSTGQLSALATQSVLDAKQDLIAASDSSKYYRGDKTWATFPSIPNPQVQTDWNAVSGMGVLLNKPTLVTVATSGAYSDLSGRPTLATVATSGDYGDLTNKPTLGTAAAQNSTAFATAAQGVKADTALQPGWTGQNTITTVGTISTGTWQGTSIGDTYISSASTWNGKLSPTGNGSSLTGLTKTQVGLGNVENTALSTWTGSTNVTTLGTVGTGTWQGTPIANSYIASAATWNAKEPAISTGLNTQFWRGDKTWAVPPTTPSYSTSTVSRSLNSSFVPSSTRPAFVTYSVEISASLTLTGGQTGTVYLETSPDNSAWTEVARISNGNTGTLAVGIAITQAMTGTLTGFIPTNYYARLRTQNNTGSPTITYRSGAETLS